MFELYFYRLWARVFTLKAQIVPIYDEYAEKTPENKRDFRGVLGIAEHESWPNNQNKKYDEIQVVCFVLLWVGPPLVKVWADEKAESAKAGDTYDSVKEGALLSG